LPRFSKKAYLLPRKTDSNNPGDWIFFAESEVQGLETLAERVRPLCTSLAEVYFSGRYPGFDLDDPDWPSFREKLHAGKEAIALVKTRLSS
jgi:hypothetical protein